MCGYSGRWKRQLLPSWWEPQQNFSRFWSPFRSIHLKGWLGQNLWRLRKFVSFNWFQVCNGELCCLSPKVKWQYVLKLIRVLGIWWQPCNGQPIKEFHISFHPLCKQTRPHIHPHQWWSHHCSMFLWLGKLWHSTRTLHFEEQEVQQQRYLGPTVLEIQQKPKLQLNQSWRFQQMQKSYHLNLPRSFILHLSRNDSLWTQAQ